MDPLHTNTFFTPNSVKKLIKIVVSVSLICALFDQTAYRLIGIDLSSLLALSPLCFIRWFFWQPISALFLIKSHGLSFSLAIDMLFSIGMFWLFASSLIRQIGEKRFFFVFFGAGITSALSVLTYFLLAQDIASLSLFYPVLMGLCMLWALTVPRSQLLLFFFFPMSAKWFFALSFGLPLASSLLAYEFAKAVAYFGAFCFSYLYALFALDLRSPFDVLFTFETYLKRAYLYSKRFWEWGVCGRFYKRREQLQNLRARKRAREEVFVDQTLDKINRKDKLSTYESFRLRWISFKKRR